MGLGNPPGVPGETPHCAWEKQLVKELINRHRDRMSPRELLGVLGQSMVSMVEA